MANFGSPYIDSLITHNSSGDGTYDWQLDASRVVNWAFADAGTPVSNFYGGTSLAWSEPYKEAMREVYQSWENVADINFVEVGQNENPDVTEYIVSDAGNGAIARHSYPTTTGNGGGYYAIDVNAPINPGSAGYALFLHETGHGMGLGHTVSAHLPFPGMSGIPGEFTGTFGWPNGFSTEYGFRWRPGVPVSHQLV